MELVEVKKIPIKSIEIPEWAKRTVMHEPEINDLAESIKGHGQIEPIIVREIDDGRYELISGYCRLRALEKIVASDVEAKIVRCGDDEALALSIEENLKRAEEHPFDTARKIAYMHKALGLSVREIAKMVRRDASWVEMMLKINSISPEAKEILTSRIKDYRSLYEISKLERAEEQIFISNLVVKHKFSREDIKSLVKDVEAKGLEVIEKEYEDMLKGSTAERGESLNNSEVFDMSNTSPAYKSSVESSEREVSKHLIHEDMRECSICGERVPRREVKWIPYCRRKHDVMDELLSWLHSFGKDDRDRALTNLHEILIRIRGLDIEALDTLIKEVEKRYASS